MWEHEIYQLVVQLVCCLTGGEPNNQPSTGVAKVMDGWDKSNRTAADNWERLAIGDSGQRLKCSQSHDDESRKQWMMDWVADKGGGDTTTNHWWGATAATVATTTVVSTTEARVLVAGMVTAKAVRTSDNLCYRWHRITIFHGSFSLDSSRFRNKLIFPWNDCFLQASPSHHFALLSCAASRVHPQSPVVVVSPLFMPPLPPVLSSTPLPHGMPVPTPPICLSFTPTGCPVASCGTYTSYPPAVIDVPPLDITVIASLKCKVQNDAVKSCWQWRPTADIGRGWSGHRSSPTIRLLALALCLWRGVALTSLVDLPVLIILAVMQDGMMEGGGSGGDGCVVCGVWCVRGGEPCKEALKQLYLGY